MSKYEARQDFCWSVALDTWEGGDVVKEAVLYTLSKLGPEVAENSGANLELHLSGAHGTVTIERNTQPLPCAVELVHEGRALGPTTQPHTSALQSLQNMTSCRWPTKREWMASGLPPLARTCTRFTLPKSRSATENAVIQGSSSSTSW